LKLNPNSQENLNFLNKVQINSVNKLKKFYSLRKKGELSPIKGLIVR